MNKTRIVVIFGGTNTEHDVSVLSATAIFNNLDRTKYDVLPVKITKNNEWISFKQLPPGNIQISAETLERNATIHAPLNELSRDKYADVVFPVLHGPYGEDGTVQGLLELMHLPYVGCGVSASAVCMDKVLQKKICQSEDINIAPFTHFTKLKWVNNRARTISSIKKKLSSFPYFVKPASQGSSVGVTKAHNQSELEEGIDEALTRDHKAIVEDAIANTREIECSVIGTTDNPKASVLGEIIPGNEFYDYEAKYESDTSRAIIPADLPVKLYDEIRHTAVRAFRSLNCYGLARVDFLLDDKSKKYYLNELNTMPGFTQISMYPKLWEASGLKYQELLTTLIDLAIQRHQDKKTINLFR